MRGWLARNFRFLRALGIFTAVIAALSVAQRPVTGMTWWVPFLATVAGMLFGIAVILLMPGRR